MIWKVQNLLSGEKRYLFLLLHRLSVNLKTAARAAYAALKLLDFQGVRNCSGAQQVSGA